VLFVGMGLGVLSSIMFASPLLTVLKDREPKIKAHNARVLARRAAAKSGDVAPARKRTTTAATKEPAVPDDEVPALASTSPRPGARPTAKRNTNRGGRPGGGNRPSGGTKRR
jgi:preprotein translocase subunit SecF